MKKILRGATVAVCCLAVLYIFWQLGRAHGAAETRAEIGAETALVEEDVYEFFTCRTTEDPERLECHTVRVPGSEAPRVFDELLNELQEPKPKAEWDEHYEAWARERGSDT